MVKFFTKEISEQKKTFWSASNNRTHIDTDRTNNKNNKSPKRDPWSTPKETLIPVFRIKVLRYSFSNEFI